MALPIADDSADSAEEMALPAAEEAPARLEEAAGKEAVGREIGIGRMEGPTVVVRRFGFVEAVPERPDAVAESALLVSGVTEGVILGSIEAVAAVEREATAEIPTENTLCSTLERLAEIAEAWLARAGP